ncbi:MAG: zinc ribbon domain-containing protein, partial [Duncaniella sp.]|nr:zinc ribbon domain-containing protein [Duncaniella sp.]
MWRPKSAMSDSPGSTCPFCQAEVNPGDTICCQCGHSLSPDKCSFCGSTMKAGAKFCTRCGQPKAGLICDKCGTFNSRNFCRKCNSPLTL